MENKSPIEDADRDILIECIEKNLPEWEILSHIRNIDNDHEIMIGRSMSFEEWLGFLDDNPCEVLLKIHPDRITIFKSAEWTRGPDNGMLVEIGLTVKSSSEIAE